MAAPIRDRNFFRRTRKIYPRPYSQIMADAFPESLVPSRMVTNSDALKQQLRARIIGEIQRQYHKSVNNISCTVPLKYSDVCVEVFAELHKRGWVEMLLRVDDVYRHYRIIVLESDLLRT